MKVLVVVDMQNDFVTGALGTAEAAAIVPKVAEKMERFDGLVLATRDTHGPDYLQSREGRELPVVHCVRGTWGWELCPEVADRLTEPPVDKPAFGSPELAELLRRRGDVESVTLVGVCTDICVISNALMLRSVLPEVPVTVDASCCAGVTPERHATALDAMTACQIAVEGR